MGHTRLGPIPKSRKWDSVIELFTVENIQTDSNSSDFIQELSARTLAAAEDGLRKAIKDGGLQYTFYILTQIASQAKEENWKDRLQRIGIQLPESITLFDFTDSVLASVDYQLEFNGKRPTDISEMAQSSAGEALCELLAGHSDSMFESDIINIQSAVRTLSTTNGFSNLGHKFFSKFLSKYLNFYLSRITASETGTAAVPHVNSISSFNSVLEHHCSQSAIIVKNFCGQWYSKTNYLSSITPDNSRRFVAHAINKLVKEIKRQGREVE